MNFEPKEATWNGSYLWDAADVLFHRELCPLAGARQRLALAKMMHARVGAEGIPSRLPADLVDVIAFHHCREESRQVEDRQLRIAGVRPTSVFNVHQHRHSCAKLDALEDRGRTWLAARSLGTMYFDLKSSELLQLLCAAGAVDVMPAWRPTQNRRVRFPRDPMSGMAMEHAMVVCGRGVREAVSSVAAKRVRGSVVDSVANTRTNELKILPSIRAAVDFDSSVTYAHVTRHNHEHTADERRLMVEVDLRLLYAAQRLAFAKSMQPRVGKRSLFQKDGRYLLYGSGGQFARLIGELVLKRGQDAHADVSCRCFGPCLCWRAQKQRIKLVNRWAAAGGGYELSRLTAIHGLRSCAPLRAGARHTWIEPVAARQRDVAVVAAAAAAALRRLSSRNRPKTERALLKWLGTWLHTTKVEQVFSMPLRLAQQAVRKDALTRAAHQAGCIWWK